jgi:uroporphyrin-III C-methyltransferase/precorrin-2 dehydrogenase/sirohydrochlorin ferrochelatase
MSRATSRLFPLFLKIEGRRVLVVGAGDVAERKIADLADAGGEVYVVAPEATVAVRALAEQGAITWHARPFEERDVDGAWLVIASTRDAIVQRRASDAAESRRVFCVAVDDLPNGSAYSAAIVRRDPFTIAISSSAEAPALTRLLRELLEQILPEPNWVLAARELRAKWKKDGVPMASRFGELVRAFKERSD